MVVLKNTGLKVRSEKDIHLGRRQQLRMRLLLGLDESRVHVGDNTAGSDGGLSEALVELFVVLDGKLDVARADAVLLVVLGGVASKLEELSCQVLQDGSHVHRSTSTDTTGEAALLQVACETANGEGQASLGGATLGSSGLLHGLLGSFAGHDVTKKGKLISELRKTGSL